MEKRERTSGIYKILNTVNKKFYVGSSKDIEGRKIGHLSELRRGVHHSKYLQNSWNKYKEENFVFIILEKCPQKELIDREQYYIDELKPVYNVVQLAVPVGYQLLSQEVKDKISESHIKNRDNNPNCHLKTVGAKNLIQDFNSGLNYKELSEKYNLTRNYITTILTGEKYKDLNYLVDKELYKRNSNIPIGECIHVFNSNKEFIEVLNIKNDIHIKYNTVPSSLSNCTKKHSLYKQKFFFIYQSDVQNFLLGLYEPKFRYRKISLEKDGNKMIFDNQYKVAEYLNTSQSQISKVLLGKPCFLTQKIKLSYV